MPHTFDTSMILDEHILSDYWLEKHLGVFSVKKRREVLQRQFEEFILVNSFETSSIGEVRPHLNPTTEDPAAFPYLLTEDSGMVDYYFGINRDNDKHEAIKYTYRGVDFWLCSYRSKLTGYISGLVISTHSQLPRALLKDDYTYISSNSDELNFLDEQDVETLKPDRVLLAHNEDSDTIKRIFTKPILEAIEDDSYIDIELVRNIIFISSSSFSGSTLGSHLEMATSIIDSCIEIT